MPRAATMLRSISNSASNCSVHGEWSRSHFGVQKPLPEGFADCRAIDFAPERASGSTGGSALKSAAAVSESRLESGRGGESFEPEMGLGTIESED